MIENLLQQTYSANVRGVPGGQHRRGRRAPGGLVLPWLSVLKLVLALVVIGGLSAALRFTGWGRVRRDVR